MATYSVVALSVWLAWEVVKAPLADRAPPALAVRLSPSSPEVLRRASEAELLAKRYDSAQDLATYSLSKAPFNARALRVWGLAEAWSGQEASADEVLTLAGNWSLRDDPAHAWLIEYRLRRGDYNSSFAHADTIARRRPDLYPQVFRLFETTASTDRRALPALLRLLARNPPWRDAFFGYLHDEPARAGLLATLAVALDRTDGPMSTTDLQLLYTVWTNRRRFEGLRLLRRTLGRPPEGGLQNGDFQTDLEDQFYPFGWRIGSGPGVAPSVIEDDDRPGNFALRIDYDGFGRTLFAEQLATLDPGSYDLSARLKAETARDDIRMEWTITCADTGEVIARSPIRGAAPGRGGWSALSTRFAVPAARCTAQWIRLEPVSGDRRTTIAVWFDDVRLRPAPARPGTSAEAPPSQGRQAR